VSTNSLCAFLGPSVLTIALQIRYLQDLTPLLASLGRRGSVAL
jgi:hypothetical protein